MNRNRSCEAEPEPERTGTVPNRNRNWPYRTGTATNWNRMGANRTVVNRGNDDIYIYIYIYIYMSGRQKPSCGCDYITWGVSFSGAPYRSPRFGQEDAERHPTLSCAVPHTTQLICCATQHTARLPCHTPFSPSAVPHSLSAAPHAAQPFGSATAHGRVDALLKYRFWVSIIFVSDSY